MDETSTLTLKKRWEMVHDRLARESQAATFDGKLAQLESLMSSVDDFGWRERLGDDDDRVRGLWMRLRLACQRG